MKTFYGGSIRCADCAAVRIRDLDGGPAGCRCGRVTPARQPSAATSGRPHTDAPILDRSRQSIARRMIGFEYP
jgi:hypothetical protein